MRRPEALKDETVGALRRQTVLRIERTLLLLRYIGYGLLALFFLAGVEVGVSGPAVAILIAAAVIHNAFTHWVLATRRYHYFFSPANYAMHVGRISLVVGLTGGEYSTLLLVYPIIVMAQTLYAPFFRLRFRTNLVTGFLFLAAVGLSLLAGGREYPFDAPKTIMYFVTILAAGWMVLLLGDLLNTLARQAHAQREALASSEAMLRTILESPAAAIIVYDNNEIITEANERALEVLRAPRSEVVGRRFRAFLFDDGTLPNKFSMLRSRGEYVHEEVLLPAQGDERTVSMHIRTFLRENKRHYLAIFHDISEHKEVAEAARVGQLRLEELHDRLVQLDRLRADLLGSIGRGVRSPLAAALGHAEMLLNGDLGEISPDQRQSLRSLRRSILRIFSTIDEVVRLDQQEPDTKAPSPASREDGAARH